MDRELAQMLPTYTHPAALIVDEVGCLTSGTDAANMLFHVVNERHRRHRPMAVANDPTCALLSSRKAEYFADSKLAGELGCQVAP